MIDDKGRCCGRKPIVYKARYCYNPLRRDYFYCHRCDKSYEAFPPYDEIDRSRKTETVKSTLTDTVSNFTDIIDWY